MTVRLENSYAVPFSSIFLLCLLLFLLHLFGKPFLSCIFFYYMPSRFKKNRKARGSVSAGHGRIGKHRKHPSGRGNAGGMHHHKINFDKYHPGYFGKVGQRHLHMKKNVHWKPAVNLDRVESLVPAEDWKACEGTSKLPVVDLLRHGYAKVLGNGRITRPVIVKARYCSRIAEKKLKEIGGAVVLRA